MKNKALVISFLSASLFTVTCANARAASQQVENAKNDTENAAQDVKDYTFAEKAEFTKKMKIELVEINKDLDHLDAKIKGAGDTAREEAKPKLQALREKAELLGVKIDAAENATESTWDAVKSDSRNTYDELKHGVSEARRWVSDKLAP